MSYNIDTKCFNVEEKKHGKKQERAGNGTVRKGIYWNDWTTTLYYITNPNLYTLQYNLEQILKESERSASLIQQAQQSGRPFGSITSDMTPEAIQAAQIIISTLPIIVVYPFLQKYFVQGVTLGSVKE